MKDYSNCISYKLSTDKYSLRYYVVRYIKYDCEFNYHKLFNLKTNNEDKYFGALFSAQDYAGQIYLKYYDKFNGNLSVVIEDELVKGVINNE